MAVSCPSLWLTPLYEKCRNMPFCGRARRGLRVRFPKEERCTESPPTFICGKRHKNRRKPVKMKILSSGVVFTFEEGRQKRGFCSYVPSIEEEIRPT
ncbi:hypothetical protein HKD37_15G043227 [Glycine soja]